MRYDLIVVGSGPAGQKAAIAAAKQNWRVLVVERRQELLGGVSLHTGTIPSKTIREAILHLTGYRHRDVYDECYRRKREITMDDLRRMIRNVNQTEWHVIQDQFARNRVSVMCGEAAFVDPHHVEVQSRGENQIVEGRHILLAPGTRPSRPSHIPFNGETIFDSDEILWLARVPRSMIVVGGGVIGLEYAIMFATLGVQVTVVDGRAQLLEFCDREIIETLLHHARSLSMVFRLGESVVTIREPKPGRVAVELESGKRLLGETVLFSVGRAGDTEALCLDRAGLEVDKRGRIKCNAHFQTAVPHIYAVGDVVGFPALASTSMEQGRQAACHMMGHEFEPCQHMPYGLFTIPEISMVGQNEQQLTDQRVPYEVGMARFSEIARGQIAGDHSGMLKLLFHRDTRKLLGVHVIGESATEIIHIGQAVMALNGTIEYFRDTVFNYPTMAECYKVAALAGLNKLSLWEEAESESGEDMPTIDLATEAVAAAVLV
ncbi:MAG TPA: Si-specific NAD(P)(+) transhydrogenase [Lacipirellulaceae bacterium]|nr:Si-specific NAD(P)(+) transhydrogenase [Lacipirellulaceae bacterium]